MSRSDVAVLISSHDRTDDARVNMEIIRASWPAELGDVLLVHAINGPRHWRPYLEDRTLVVPPGSSHFAGAAQLIDAGTALIGQEHPGVRYVVSVASDTWLYRPARVRDVIEQMRAEDRRLAAARFEVSDRAHGVRRQRGDDELLPGTGLTTDFFIVDLPWALEFGLLPLDLAGFVQRFGPILNYFQEIVLLERHVEGMFLGAVRRYLERTGSPKDGLGSEGLRQARRLLRLLHERPIDDSGRTAPAHKGHWPQLGLITIEDPPTKQGELRGVARLGGGPTLDRFLADDDLSWFNQS